MTQPTAQFTTVWVLSWVYWNGESQGGGGFDWWPAEPKGNARDIFDSEVKRWGQVPCRVRWLTAQVPAGLTGEEITDYLDSDIDQIESTLPAIYEHDSSPKAAS